MDCVSPIIGLIVDSLFVTVKKHLGFLVSSTKYVNKMEDKMKQLNDIAQEVQDKLDNAVGNIEVVPARAEPWLEDVKKLNERSDEIEAIGCFSVTERYKVGKQSYGILEEIKDLEDRQSKIMFTHEQKPLAEVGSTSAGPSTSAAVPMGTQNDFESRRLIFSDAMQALQSDKESQRMIALCGMGGVGKTTMMEQLKKAVEYSKMFDLVVKVVVGENNDAIYLQKAIAEYMGNKLDETIKDARADRLRKIFEVKSQQGQMKILVIMDDLWKEVDLTDVGLCPLPIGFKLLFTSRFEYVCIQMGVRTDSIFRIGMLNDTEAQTLFSTIVGPSPLDGDDADLQIIGNDIAKKCGGLPIAIVTIAKSLKGNIKEAWKEALSNLQHHDLQDLEGIVHKVFEMSYNNLKKEDDKAIFLLCGLFPDDFNIPIENLMMYGWGLNLFAKVHTLTKARMRANICVNNLICANLLIEGDQAGCVKMHDLTRTFVLSNFSKVKRASIVNQDNMSWEHSINDSYERILLKCASMSGFPADINYTNLSLLILMGGYELFQFPEDMEKITKKLEVVSFENMGVPLLPIAFKHSNTLRTMCLRSCSLIDDISFIGSLCNLETLSLVDCNIKRLPSTIGKLKKLMLLDVTGCVDLSIDNNVFQNLGNLKELYMRASKGRPIRFTHANCNELEKLSQGLLALEFEFYENKVKLENVSFKKLERFRISIGCELKNYEKYSFRNTLNLVAECSELNECNIGDLFKNTEELRLQVKYMIHLEDISFQHTLSQLRYLHISKCTELTYLFTVDMANGLNQLERLTISECPLLEAIIGENTGVGLVTLKKLRIMSLENLPKMVRLCDNVVDLPELMELRIVVIPNFTSIYPDSNTNTSEMQPLFNKEGVIPKLEKIDVSKMDNLKQIWPCQISMGEKDDVSMLREIRVRECDKLINPFPRNPLPLLNHLEEVVVEKCGSIEVLFNIDFESVCGMEKDNSSRLRRIRVHRLRKLKELWRMIGVNEPHMLVNSFKNVQTILIEQCDNFTDVFTPTTTNFDLGALTDYFSYNSGELDKRERKDKMIEGDHESYATYPSYLLHTCHHLQRLELLNDKRVEEVVFDMDGPSSRGQLATTIQSPLLLLPHLQSIRLWQLEETSHVWKCINWNKFLIPQLQPLQFPFQNLSDIDLLYCHKIKYLFSPLMAKYLSNLKNVYLNQCDSMEEVISNRDDENTASTSSNQKTTFFPHFDTLKLRKLPCLKCIGGEENTWRDKISSNITNTQLHDHLQNAPVTYWSMCQYPKKISIEGCHALSSLIPWYAAGQMKRLQELKIERCKTMTEVFESELVNNINSNNIDEGDVTSSTSATMKNVTTPLVPQLSNLEIVCIYDCDCLRHVFTFSALKTLNRLKRLEVKRCKKIQVIAKQEKDMSSEVVVFPRLETLELDDLEILEGFFLGINDFQCPSLVNVMINDCPQWVKFTSGELKTPKLKNIHTSLGTVGIESGFNFQATFPTYSDPTISKDMPSSFHNLIEVNIEDRDVGRTNIIPSHELLQLEKLQQITIIWCSKVEEIFEVVASEGTNKSQTVVAIPNLRQVKLSLMLHLKYLWKSNQWMVLEFPNLTTVDIYMCHSLEHVFTCSMVGSLVQLQDLSIRGSDDIEVIVKEEDECDAGVNEIVLPRLKSLKLEELSSLKGFCLGKEAFSLPALDTLQIEYCPAITVFTKGHVSTPELKDIDTSFGKCGVMTDVNSFIEAKQEEGHEF